LMKWRLLNTGEMSGFDNMAIDEAIMLSHFGGKKTLPTLRFYGPPRR